MKNTSFADLFQNALQEWPKQLALTELLYQEGGRYIVAGLGQLLDKIDSRQIGLGEEVLLRELHWSIFSVVHALARGILVLDLSDLRAEEVQRVFNQRLRSALNAKDPAWDTADFDLVSRYLKDKV